jgi:hypothetical protein
MERIGFPLLDDPATTGSGIRLSTQSLIDHIVRKHLPIVAGVPEALRLSRHVLGLGTRMTAIILHDSGPLFERVDVWDGV